MFFFTRLCFNIIILYEQMKMAPKSCPCGSCAIEEDQSSGTSYCTSCGNVLEVNNIVSEMQFEANNHGGSSAVGQFLSNENQGGTGFMNSFRGGSGRSSQEATLKKAEQRIALIGSQLK